jgi:hypothetical protein
MTTRAALVTINTVAGIFILPSYASDGAFVAAKGSAAANGDAYYSSTFGGMREYQAGVWRSVSNLAQIAAKTTTYAISLDDDVVTGDATSAGFTATLPTAVGNKGKCFTLKKTDSTFNLVTIATTSAQTIDGASTIKLATQNEAVTVVSDNSNWQISSRRIPSTSTAFTPTGSWSANSTYTGFWRRVGDSINIRIKIALAGAPTSATLTGITGPSGLTWDTAKRPVLGSDSGFGSAYIFRGSDKAMGHVMYSGSGATVDVMYDVGDGTAARVSQSVPGTFANGDFIELEYTMPITGWEG